MIKRFKKKRTKGVDLETLLGYCLTRDQEKIPPLEKVLASPEIEKLDTDTWEGFYLSLARVLGEREKLRHGQAQTIEEMLSIWGELLSEEDKKKNLILKGNLVRQAGRLGENKPIYCPHLKEFKDSPLSYNLHEFKGFEEWIKDKVLGDIQKESLRLSPLGRRGGVDIEGAISSWMDFYNFLCKVRLGQEEGRDLYSRKIKMVSLNLDDETLKKDINAFLGEVPSLDKLKKMDELFFYRLSRSWNSINLALLERQAKVGLAGGKKKKEEAPISKLLHKWRDLGEYIGGSEALGEADFQKIKRDIVYYAAHISYFLVAPAELTSNIFRALSWFVDSQGVINAPTHRIYSLREEWNRVLLWLERFQAEKELRGEDEGKDILLSLEKLLPLWSELEELTRTGTPYPLIPRHPCGHTQEGTGRQARPRMRRNLLT